MRAYRLKPETVLEIERLSDEWECAQAEVIERAVQCVGEGFDLQPVFRTTKEAMEYAQRNKIPTVIPATTRPAKPPLLKPSEKKGKN
jgi:hypothetical protein